MLRSTVARTVWSSFVASRRVAVGEMRSKVLSSVFASKLNLASAVEDHSRSCHSETKSRVINRQTMLASLIKKDQGTYGEASVDIDSKFKESVGMFPDENTPELLFDGVRFADLPIVHIKTTDNNTIMSLTDAKGNVEVLLSCGMEGYKNSRKGTNVAAQATGVSLGLKATRRGLSNVRVKVKGLGPGRMSGIKGLTLGGLNVVSITDTTWINWNNNPRPRKAKKL